MSVKVSSWVWHQTEVAGNELLLLLAIADITDDEGRVRFTRHDSETTYAALARKVRVDKRTVLRRVASLRDQGLLEHVPGRKGTPNEFRILMGDDLSPKGSGDTSATYGDTSDPDLVTTAPTFGDTGNTRSSYRRMDVTTDVDVSDVEGRSEPKKKYSAEVERLCVLLEELVTQNGYDVENPGDRWLQACDRLIRLDGYTAVQVEWMIRWATGHEFWSANIRSMPKLREKFSTMKAQVLRDQKQGAGVSTVQHGRTVDRILADREGGRLELTS